MNELTPIKFEVMKAGYGGNIYLNVKIYLHNLRITYILHIVQQYLINNFGSTTSLTNILSDLGFYYATNTDNRINYGPVMKNLTYIYARGNNYSVSVGRIGKFECDPIQHRNGIIHKNMPELMKNGELF